MSQRTKTGNERDKNVQNDNHLDGKEENIYIFHTIKMFSNTECDVVCLKLNFLFSEGRFDQIIKWHFK